MDQCLNCSGPCVENSVFCEQCQVSSAVPVVGASKNSLQNSAVSSFAPGFSFASNAEASLGMPFESQQGNFSQNEASTLLSVLGGEGSSADQALLRLNAAARWIEEAEEEPNGKRLRRSVRLSPLRDISAEIQRASTPYPIVHPESASSFDTRPEKKAGVSAQVEQVPQRNAQSSPSDAWPWFDGANENEEEKEGDLWANATDPFVARSRPTVAEARQVEENDIWRVHFEEQQTIPQPVTRPLRPGRLSSSWRMVFVGMIVLAVIALAIDGMLLSVAFNHNRSATSSHGGPATLTLSTNAVSVGSTVTIRLTHFAPLTQVALTHDIQEVLFTTANISSLQIDANGEASALISINSLWAPGSHLIVAEDVTTRDVASGPLLINGEGPSRPPHLLLDSSTLNFGEAVQGANTTQPLVLHNTGSGSISWSAGSDQPWLLVAPSQGTFGVGQTIAVAVQRSHLQPGDYQGTLTISSNVSAPEQIQVIMSVTALPPDAGPMISLAPPLLSFTAVDASSSPAAQVLTLTNPGSQMLSWTLDAASSTTSTMQTMSDFQPSQGDQTSPLSTSPGSSTPGGGIPWLSANVTSGSLAPGQSQFIEVMVRSQSLLPNSYMGVLTFHSPKAFDTPQVVDVSLTVQSHCGLLANTGYLSFTAVIGQSNPSAQTLGLSATSGCPNSTLDWQALPSFSWITASPASGQIKGVSGSVAAIGVTTGNLPPGSYNGAVTFQAGKNTLTVTVHLVLQPRPSPSTPIMGVSSLGLNFSAVQGQANPAGQAVTITNNGGGALSWHSGLVMLASSWINITPSGGTILPGQTGHLTVNIATGTLTPGNYASQVVLLGTDAHGGAASGSPQTITVNLVVQPPCSLAQPSASSLVFSGTAGGSDPVPQLVTLMGSGSCSWPLKWKATSRADGLWVSISPDSGFLDATSQQGSFMVGVSMAGIAPGDYKAQIKINAVDSLGVEVQGSQQTIGVKLTVLQPCTLQPLPSALTFDVAQGQVANSQTLSLATTGTCGGGISWSATSDAASNNWLNLPVPSGTADSITVSATAAALSPGTYTGQITISANNNGVVLQGSPQTIPVVINVAGYTISGTAIACDGPAPTCTNLDGLADATVSLISGGQTTMTVTTDASGNYTFTKVPLGSYSIAVSGTVGTTTYTGVTSVVVIGNTGGADVQTFSTP